MESGTNSIFGPNGLLEKLESQNSCDTTTTKRLDFERLKDDFQDQREIASKRPRLDPDEEDENQTKIVHCNDDLTILKENHHSKVQVVALQSLPVAQAVFSIDKIRQKIFSQLNLTDLRNCRLVSRALKIYTTNDDTLLNSDENYINIYKTRKAKSFKIGFDFCSKGTLEQLTNTMNTTGANPFPCNYFAISYKVITDDAPDLCYFLDNHGFRIKRLDLELFYAKSKSSNEMPSQNIVTFTLIPWITRLILKQAPNLEKLTIEINESSSKSVNANKNFCKKPVEGGDELESENHNLKLRHVTLKDNIPKSLFECICNLAPKLVDLKTKKLEYYYESKNRLNLCPEIMFSPRFIRFVDGSYILYSRVFDIANMDGNLQVKSLIMFMESLLLLDEFSTIQPQVVSTCNRLLSKCKDSLELIWMDQMGFLSGVTYPQMSKVKEIHVMKLDSGMDNRYFAKGNRISKCLPNLQTIIVSNLDELANPDEFPLGSDDQVLTSVKYVKVCSKFDSDFEEYKVTLIRRWFPNAIVGNL